MGGTSSSNKETENVGLFNGNKINNGQIFELIEKDIIDIDLWLKIALIVQVIYIITKLVRYSIKTIKKNHDRNSKLNKVVVQRY